MSGAKTFSNETSERYALALFELASENLQVEEIDKNVSFLLDYCKNNLAFANFLKNPTYQLEIQSKIFLKISKIMKLNTTLSNFIQLIISKRRIYFLEKILKNFNNLSSKKKGKIDAIFISSKDLSEEERKKINQDISKAIKSNINFSYKTDKTLISGIKIQVGSLLIDTTVSNKLKRLKQSMLES